MLRLETAHAVHYQGAVGCAAKAGRQLRRDAHAMTTLLRIAAAVSLAWAVMLLAFKVPVLGTSYAMPVARGLGNALAITHLALAFCFLYAARDPVTHRAGVYTAILLMALKMTNDVYELLILLPADQALISLADLVLSVGLLVGLLEALPRTFGTRPPAE